MTGDGSRRFFTNYINNRQEPTVKTEIALIMGFYLIDFERIS